MKNGEADRKLFRISPADNVAVALSGEKVGHKFALRRIRAGEKVIKYGMPIGTALCDIEEGEHVHTHNLKTLLAGEEEYVYRPSPEALRVPETKRKDVFSGYARPDGSVGIRNDLWVIPTVGCANSLAENLCRKMNLRLASLNPEQGSSSFSPCPQRALPLLHPYGCSQLGEDHERTAELLAALCKHPNAGGVLVISLGCENNTLESFRKRLGDLTRRNIRFLLAQEEEDEWEAGMELLESLRKESASCVRGEFPVSKLKVGLKCGGSDGFSGITANPLVGRFSDLLIAQGGTSVLTEVPEMFGAETLLMNRCISREVFDKCVEMVNGFKRYFLSHGQVVYENPSPGNKAGGISTLEDKSLGCTQKGGFAPVTDVLRYGESVSISGLNLLSAPGNDMVASTALAAAGCHLILFTTGRGTPYGTVVPTLKISTNSALAEKKPHWIDFDAGVLLGNEKVGMDELAGQFMDFVLEIASGKKCARNEEHRCQEIAIFKDGVTL